MGNGKGSAVLVTPRTVAPEVRFRMRFDSTAKPSDKYAVAQQRIACGDWRVDAVSGIVYGSRKRPVGSSSRAGYVVIGQWFNGQMQPGLMAHRVIWEAVNGPIPDGLQVNHKNGIKSDNRVENLELVTASGNVRHAVRTGLFGMAKLTADAIPSIRERLRNGENAADIAADYGVKTAAIDGVGLGVRWQKVVPVSEGESAYIRKDWRLTDEQKEEVLRRVEAGESYRAVAADVGVSYVTVWRWCRKCNGAKGRTEDRVHK